MRIEPTDLESLESREFRAWLVKYANQDPKGAIKYLTSKWKSVSEAFDLQVRDNNAQRELIRDLRLKLENCTCDSKEAAKAPEKPRKPLSMDPVPPQRPSMKEKWGKDAEAKLPPNWLDDD